MKSIVLALSLSLFSSLAYANICGIYTVKDGQNYLSQNGHLVALTVNAEVEKQLDGKIGKKLCLGGVINGIEVDSVNSCGTDNDLLTCVLDSYSNKIHTKELL